MGRRLTEGEETLPIAELNGRFYTPAGAMRLRQRGPITDRLLIERVRRRVTQGREARVLRVHGDYPHEYSPKDILKAMMDGDQEFLSAERKLLEHQLKQLEKD